MEISFCYSLPKKRAWLRSLLKRNRMEQMNNKAMKGVIMHIQNRAEIFFNRKILIEDQRLIPSLTELLKVPPRMHKEKSERNPEWIERQIGKIAKEREQQNVSSPDGEWETNTTKIHVVLLQYNSIHPDWFKRASKEKRNVARGTW